MPTNLSEQAILSGFKESALIKNILEKKPLETFVAENRTKAFVKIAQFLTDGPQFLAALKTLEQEMTAEFMSRIARGSKEDYQEGMSDLLGNGDKSEMFAHRRANKYELDMDPTRHLLTQVLNTFLSLEGFTNFEKNSDGLIFGPSAYGNIEHAFGEQIQQGRIVKDYVGLDHGEFTHMIQWYCVAKQKVFLGLPGLGYQEAVKLFKVSGIFWGQVFDLNQAVGEDDFRRPENLYPWLCDPARAMEYPLLNGFLVSRRKRLDNTAYTPSRMKLILAKKFGGNPPSSQYLTMSKEQCDLEFARNPESVRTLVTQFVTTDKKNRNNKVLGGNWQALPRVEKS
jgi:hypothetical protein